MPNILLFIPTKVDERNSISRTNRRAHSTWNGYSSWFKKMGQWFSRIASWTAGSMGMWTGGILNSDVSLQFTQGSTSKISQVLEVTWNSLEGQTGLWAMHYRSHFEICVRRVNEWLLWNFALSMQHAGKWLLPARRNGFSSRKGQMYKCLLRIHFHWLFDQVSAQG